MNKVLLRHTDRSVFRERGFEDGYARRKKLDRFPSDDARAGYMEGYRIGRSRRRAERGER